MTHPSSADETGWADLDALTVRYAFPADELARQLDAFDGTEPLPDVLRTFVHEHVHFDHAVSTPFGFLLHRLRRIQSYATCDIIRVLRQDLGLRLRRLSPLLRLVKSGTILADIDPATDADDVERFQDDICAALSWVPPRAIRESTVYRPNSRLFDRFYAEGLALRRRSPGILCEPRNRLARSDIGEFLRSTFTFPIVGYADGQPVVRPGPLEVEHQRETLWHRWMRRLMIAKSPTVEVPWDSDDLDDLAAALRERLSREIGGPAPAPQLAAPST